MVNLNVNRLKDSAHTLIRELYRSFQESIVTFKEAMIEVQTRARLRSIENCVYRHRNGSGIPSSISAFEISARTGCLPENLKKALQELMDSREVLCFNIDKQTLADAISSDCLRIMREGGSHAQLYWKQNLRSPQLESYRVRNLSRLPADVTFEGLQFITSKIPKR